VPSSVEANKFSIVEKYVTEVDGLPDRFLDVKILFLSHNSVSTLAGFLGTALIHTIKRDFSEDRQHVVYRVLSRVSEYPIQGYGLYHNHNTNVTIVLNETVALYGKFAYFF